MNLDRSAALSVSSYCRNAFHQHLRSSLLLPSDASATVDPSTMPLHGELLTRLRNASVARIRQVACPYSTSNLSILSILLQQGLIHSISKGTVDQPHNPVAFATSSVPSKRLWVTLKYNKATDRPVLSTLDLVSKPSKKVFMTREELVRFVSFRRSQFVKPLEMGEVGIFRDADTGGWWEAREAVRRGKVQRGEMVARAG
ncbi:unnamed protein product [Jaminaea pallidilutea]